jgi:hypothetical protein
MKKTAYPILSLILMSVLMSLACGIGGAGSADPLPTIASLATVAEQPAVPDPTAIIEPTEAAVVAEPAATDPAVSDPSPTETAEPAPASPLTISLNAANNYGEPAGFDSYRMTLQFSSVLTGADGSVTNGAISIEGLRDVAFNATSFAAAATGTADFGGGQQFSFTELGDSAYFIMPNGSCTAFAGAIGTNPFAIFLDDGGVLGNLEGAQLADPPTETINDILTNHYIFDETNLSPTDNVRPDITAVTGDIYLAADGDYVVRVVMQGTGSSNLLNGIDGDGDIYYELNYLDFDVAVEISAPTGCTG